MAVSGTISASAGVAAGTWMRANTPGVNRPSALSNTARPRMVPEPLSTTLSMKSIRPLWPNAFSSIRRSSTGAWPSRLEMLTIPSLASRW